MFGKMMHIHWAAQITAASLLDTNKTSRFVPPIENQKENCWFFPTEKCFFPISKLTFMKKRYLPDCTAIK